MEEDYEMKISLLTIDKLGVKMYDKVSSVMAELVSNAYDADATEVSITAPMGEFLAKKEEGKSIDLGLEIIIEDNGHGMTPNEMKKDYLVVGRDRREGGDLSRKLQRKVMGRKGIGKLAPFGICKTIEVCSSGGDPVELEGEIGYQTSHIILNKDDIDNLGKDEESGITKTYKPKKGEFDGKLSKKHGTTIKMRDFDRRLVPDITCFARQLSHKFGLPGVNWKINLIDSNDKENTKQVLTKFEVDYDEDHHYTFERNGLEYKVFCAGEEIKDLDAGFHVGGKYYGIEGEMGKSQVNYKDELMTGVRIYCRGKLAGQTKNFNIPSGFPGEYTVNSYLIGEIKCDWLDDKDDLIQTDRNDLLWSDDILVEFQKWGQKLIRHIAKNMSAPVREKNWTKTKKRTDAENIIKRRYPGANMGPIRERAESLMKLFSENLMEDVVEGDLNLLKDLLELSMDFAPHFELTTQLREAAKDDPRATLKALVGMLKTARVAELASLGMVADGRVKVIRNIEGLIQKDSNAVESELQELISGAYWLIHPEWSPLTANRTFDTLKEALEKYLQEELDMEVNLRSFENGNKRVDFVLISGDGNIELIEIKKPHHDFNNEDFTRFHNYFRAMESFFKDPGNGEFKKSIHDWHVTLIADNVRLTDNMMDSLYHSMIDSKKVECMNWNAFLHKTKKYHDVFLNVTRGNGNNDT